MSSTPVVVDQLPATVHLRFVRGDTFSRRLFFYRTVDDAPVGEDVSGWEFEAQYRTRAGAEPSVDFDIDTSDADTGYVTISLDADATEALTGGVWDMQRVNGADVRTIFSGTVKPQAQVST